MIRKLAYLVVFMTAAMFGAVQAAFAGGKVEEKIKDGKDKYEYKYKDGRCDYHYKIDYRKGKSEVKQKGDCRHIAPPFKPLSVFETPLTASSSVAY